MASNDSSVFLRNGNAFTILLCYLRRCYVYFFPMWICFKRLVLGLWLKIFCFVFAEGAVFDATQYAFFGQNARVEEVELGGLEDDDCLPESNEEEFLLNNREEVKFTFLTLMVFFFFSFEFSVRIYFFKIYTGSSKRMTWCFAYMFFIILLSEIYHFHIY